MNMLEEGAEGHPLHRRMCSPRMSTLLLLAPVITGTAIDSVQGN